MAINKKVQALTGANFLELKSEQGNKDRKAAIDHANKLIPGINDKLKWSKGKNVEGYSGLTISDDTFAYLQEVYQGWELTLKFRRAGGMGDMNSHTITFNLVEGE